MTRRKFKSEERCPGALYRPRPADDLSLSISWAVQALPVDGEQIFSRRIDRGDARVLRWFAANNGCAGHQPIGSPVVVLRDELYRIGGR